MSALNWGELEQDDRELFVNLVPKRLVRHIANPDFEIPPDVAKLLWTGWRDFVRVCEQRGRDGLFKERDALQRRHDELTAKIQQLKGEESLFNEPLMEWYRYYTDKGVEFKNLSEDDPNYPEIKKLRSEGGKIRNTIRQLEDEADDIQKQINMIKAIFRYGTQMPEFIEAAYAQVKERSETVRPARKDREASGSPPIPGGYVPRDPMKWEQTAIGLYAYLENVDDTNDYPTALTGEYGIEERAKEWVKGSTSTKQTLQKMQEYGYQKRGGVPSFHTALRQWIPDFSQVMSDN